MFRLLICLFGSDYDSNKQIIIYTNTPLVTVIVGYYLKNNPSVNRQKGYGGQITCVFPV